MCSARMRRRGKMLSGHFDFSIRPADTVFSICGRMDYWIIIARHVDRNAYVDRNFTVISVMYLPVVYVRWELRYCAINSWLNISICARARARFLVITCNDCDKWFINSNGSTRSALYMNWIYPCAVLHTNDKSSARNSLTQTFPIKKKKEEIHYSNDFKTTSCPRSFAKRSANLAYYTYTMGRSKR